jgi:arsenate reductase (thioredoxin)
MVESFNVLFLCTGNSARSILAEAALNHVSRTDGRFKAFSAGSHPKGQVHPLAIEVLRQNRIPTEGLRSKSWDEFEGPDAPPIDFVFTVCGNAAAEQCPIWPGHPVTAHWGVDDPAAVEGTEDEKRLAFSEALFILERRINLFAGLPVDTLNKPALREQLEEIGRS